MADVSSDSECERQTPSPSDVKDISYEIDNTKSDASVKLTFGVESLIRSSGEKKSDYSSSSDEEALPVRASAVQTSPKSLNPFGMDCILNRAGPTPSKENTSPTADRHPNPISPVWATECVTKLPWPLKPGAFTPSKYSLLMLVLTHLFKKHTILLFENSNLFFTPPKIFFLNVNDIR